eukprot:1355430-Alexandrium_andersonii.AAC.1
MCIRDRPSAEHPWARVSGFLAFAICPPNRACANARAHSFQTCLRALQRRIRVFKAPARFGLAHAFKCAAA